MRANWLLIWLALIAPAAGAQSYAGLGDGAEGFARVVRGVPVRLPADFGPHPDFQLEWWYVTANLESPDFGPMGVQWTLFRRAAKPAPLTGDWSSPHFWMAHAAITHSADHRVGETLLRSPAVTVSTAPFVLAADGWSLTAKTGDPLGVLEARYTGSDFSYRLDLTPSAQPVAHGEDGFSQKSTSGQASYYFSQPFYTVTGTASIGGVTTTLAGKAWLDREWSSQPLDQTQKGCDWFSLHLPSGAKVMLFRLRSDSTAPYLSGSWIAPSGDVTPLARGDIRLTPLNMHSVAGRTLPTQWRVEVPRRGLDVRVAALNPDSYMTTLFPYWEGPITVIGHLGATPVEDVGYLEMTGY